MIDFVARLSYRWDVDHHRPGIGPDRGPSIMNLHRRPAARATSLQASTPILLAALAWLPGCRHEEAPKAPPPPRVGVVAARRMDVPVEATTTATTRALEEVVVRARVRGFLTEQHFEEGSMVKKGQLLLVIDEVPYQITLQSAQARLAEAEASLRKAEQSRTREVSAAQVALDEAQLYLYQVEERRSRALLSRNAGTREDVDKTEADRKKSEAQIQADRASADQAKADYEVGILAAKAQVDAAKAAVHDAEVNLGYCRMTAPIDGRIGEVAVDVGNLVGPDSAGGGNFSELCSIQQLDPMGIDIRVSSRYLERATELGKSGLSIELTRPGLDGDQVIPEKGEMYFIDNKIDQNTSTFLVRAKVPNPRYDLLPGEYLKLKMVVDRIDNATVVPETGVIESDAGPTVYFVDKDGKAAVQSVEAGQSYKGLRVLTKGLEPGVSVIVQGLQLIRPGMPVTAEPAVLPKAIEATPSGPSPAAQASAKATGEEPSAKAAPDATGAIKPAAEAQPDIQPGGPRSAIEPKSDAPRPAPPTEVKPDATPQS